MLAWDVRILTLERVVNLHKLRFCLSLWTFIFQWVFFIKYLQDSGKFSNELWNNADTITTKDLSVIPVICTIYCRFTSSVIFFRKFPRLEQWIWILFCGVKRKSLHYLIKTNFIICFIYNANQNICLLR